MTLLERQLIYDVHYSLFKNPQDQNNSVLNFNDLALYLLSEV